MHRITVSLPDDVASVVEREAERSGLSVSEIVRRSLAATLGLNGNTARTLPFAGIGRSGTTTTARDAEDVLDRDWTDVRGR